MKCGQWYGALLVGKHFGGGREMTVSTNGNSAGENRSIVSRGGSVNRRRASRAIVLAGTAALAACLAPSVSLAVSGTWNPTGFTGANGSGLWSTIANWSANLVADGADNTADFSTLNITADTTVSLDSSRSIGQLKFADTTASKH